MDFFRQHILTIVAFWPLAGMIVLLFLNKENKTLIRMWANLVMFGGFFISLPLWFWFDRATSDQMQFVESVPWVRTLGANYHVGIDGISLLMVLLTTLLGPLAVLSSWEAIDSRVKEYYVFMLMLQAGMLGVFVSLDFFLFYVFWEVMLVPMYFLIGVWGSDRRLYAAIKFFLYTLAGSVVMLLAILALYFYAPVAPGATRTFDVPTLLTAAQHFADPLKVWLFWGFFFAFAIKVPMFPFHTWLPDAHTEAPTAGSVILAGVLLNMGTYGFIRFSLPLLPADPLLRHKIIQVVIVLSLIGIIYGALVCLMQKDMKRLIAYSSVSHLGFCTLGIFALTPNGLSGSVLQQINHGISTGALFLIVGVLYERRHTRMISEFGGLATPIPNFAAIYLIVSLSSLGMPLLNGFIGEFTILQGAFQVSKAWAAWGVLGVILCAAYLLWRYQRGMFGPVTQPANEHLPDLNLRELATLVPLVFLAFWIGIYPKPFFALIDKPLENIVRQVNPNFYPPEHAKLPPAELHAAAAETK